MEKHELRKVIYSFWKYLVSINKEINTMEVNEMMVVKSSRTIVNYLRLKSQACKPLPEELFANCLDRANLLRSLFVTDSRGRLNYQGRLEFLPSCPQVAKRAAIDLLCSFQAFFKNVDGCIYIADVVCSTNRTYPVSVF